MHWFEYGVVVLAAGLGVRSGVHWIRKPLLGEPTALRDQVWFAVFVTARAGFWFALAGAFAIYASIDTREQAFVYEARTHAGYLLLVLALPVVQFVAAFFLSRGNEPP
ncbi:MAG: hypothetical protein ABI828_07955 [Actinomycetota bacterium]